MKAPYSFKNLILGTIDAYRAGEKLKAYDYVMTRQEHENRQYASYPDGVHSGGFGEIQHGFIDNKPVTFAQGWGKKAGQTLISDGHVTAKAFYAQHKGSKGHNHYGSGNGPNNNARDRGKYTGPGA